MSVPSLYLHAAVLPPYLFAQPATPFVRAPLSSSQVMARIALYLIRSSVDSSVGQAGLDTFILTCTQASGGSPLAKVIF